jgi:hypothetical protein
VRGHRIDQRAEQGGEHDVGGVADALQRRSPDDGQRDGAERELEEPLGLDGGVRESHGGEGLARIAIALQEEAVAADERAVAERQRKADGPVGERPDREVGEDLGHPRAGVLGSREADLQHREATLHEQDEERGDDHPQRVEHGAVVEPSLLHRVERVEHGQTWARRCEPR